MTVVKKTLCAAALLALLAPLAQAKQRICIYDPLGTSGEGYSAARDYVIAMQRHGVDLEIKAFIDEYQPPFIIRPTEAGRLGKVKQNAGIIAVTDFLTAQYGMRRYLATGEPVLILFEDLEWFVTPRLPNLRLLNTVSMLRELEAAGVIASADAVLAEMTHPTSPGRKTSDARALSQLF